MRKILIVILIIINITPVLSFANKLETATKGLRTEEYSQIIIENKKLLSIVDKLEKEIADVKSEFKDKKSDVDLIYQVDSYYKSSFDKLAIIISVMLGVTGIYGIIATIFFGIKVDSKINTNKKSLEELIESRINKSSKVFNDEIQKNIKIMGNKVGNYLTKMEDKINENVEHMDNNIEQIYIATSTTNHYTGQSFIMKKEFLSAFVHFSISNLVDIILWNGNKNSSDYLERVKTSFRNMKISYEKIPNMYKQANKEVIHYQIKLIIDELMGFDLYNRSKEIKEFKFIEKILES